MPIFGERRPAAFPSGLEWGSGRDGLLGTPTADEAVIVDASEQSVMGITEEFPTSPEIERAEQATIVHRFKTDWDSGLILIQVIGRGYLMEDAFGNDTYVLASKLERRPGGMAEFTVTAEGVNFDAPPDEFEVQPVEFNPPIFYHPRYETVRTYNLDEDGNQIDPALLTGFQIIQRLQAATMLVQIEAREMDVNALTPDNIDDPLVLGLVDELLQKLRKGEDEFYMVGWRVTLSRYFFQAPPLNPGGYVSDPVLSGELPYYFWSTDRFNPSSNPFSENIFLILPSNVNPILFPSDLGSTVFSWFRQADQLLYQRTWFKKVSSWIAAPLGTWDPDIYPNYVNPVLGGP